MIAALLAALSMVACDVLATIMVMAESREMGWVAGILDAAGWLVSIACTAISVDVLTGSGPLVNKVYVVVFVSAANLLGTKAGQEIGSRVLPSKKLHHLLARLGAKDRPQLTPAEIKQLQLMAAAARSGR